MSESDAIFWAEQKLTTERRPEDPPARGTVSVFVLLKMNGKKIEEEKGKRKKKMKVKVKEETRQLCCEKKWKSL